MKILALNPGSSSLKFAVHASDGSPDEPPLMRGSITRLGRPDATLSVEIENVSSGDLQVGPIDLPEAVRRSILAVQSSTTIDAVGCRVVHGGPDFSVPVRITPRSLGAIRLLKSLAPLHNPADVEAIEATIRELPKTPVFAVFDTSFHRSLPPEAALYALPQALAKRYGIRRYGFHGISYSYVWDRLAAGIAGGEGRLIACHLGNGASVCAIRQGRSVDTSMGMTPLEGLIMGTRSGDVDPGVLLVLQREAGMSPTEVDNLLNQQSGLLGISGLSPDVRELEEAAGRGEGDAELALSAFAYRVAKYIGAYAVTLGGIDALAFTGGIGENSSHMRSRICSRLQVLGVSLDESPRTGPTPYQVGRPGSVPVWVVQADEERQIARDVSSAARSRIHL